MSVNSGKTPGYAWKVTVREIANALACAVAAVSGLILAVVITRKDVVVADVKVGLFCVFTLAVALGVHSACEKIKFPEEAEDDDEDD